MKITNKFDFVICRFESYSKMDETFSASARHYVEIRSSYAASFLKAK